MRELEDGKRQRLAALEQQVGDDDADAEARGIEISSGRAIRGSYYPPVEIDAGVVEWFMKHARSRMAMVFDINDVLKSHIRAKDKAAKSKKAG